MQTDAIGSTAAQASRRLATIYLSGTRVRYANEPGVLRRFWWRGTQKRRLAVVCSSALLSVAGTGLVLIGGEQTPSTPAFAASFPSTTTPPQPTDPAVTVRAVTAVDQFEGVGTASGDLIRVRVIDIRSTAPCWQAESLDFARDALLGKKVLLAVTTSGQAPDGRLPAHVRLPEGQDFALTALTAGAALAGTTEVDPELLAAETSARMNHLGLWANACAPNQDQSRPSTSESTIATTTTSPASRSGDTTAPTSTTTDPATTDPAATDTTPPADVQQEVQVAKPCSPEGAIGVSRNGRDVICEQTLLRGLRWAVR